MLFEYCSLPLFIPTCAAMEIVMPRHTQYRTEPKKVKSLTRFWVVFAQGYVAAAKAPPDPLKEREKKKREKKKKKETKTPAQ